MLVIEKCKERGKECHIITYIPRIQVSFINLLTFNFKQEIQWSRLGEFKISVFCLKLKSGVEVRNNLRLISDKSVWEISRSSETKVSIPNFL